MGSNIRKVSKNGGAVTVLASGIGAVNEIAVDATNVYWTEYNELNGNGAIKSVPKNGGTITTLASGTPAGSVYDVFSPVGLTLDLTYVYWGETVGGGAIRRVPKVGGQVVDIGRGQGSVFFLVLDASQTNFYILGDSASFFRLPVGGGIRQVLATKVGVGLTGPLAIDQSAIYSEDLNSAGTIFGVPLSGGPVNYLVRNEFDPHNVAIDQNYVFFPHARAGSSAAIFHFVKKVSKAGGTPIVYPNCSYTTATEAAGVAVDATDIYVVGTTSSASAVVFKLAK